MALAESSVATGIEKAMVHEKKIRTSQVLTRFGASVFELYQQQIQALLGLASATYATVAGTSDTQAIADRNEDKSNGKTPAKDVATTTAMAAAAAKAANAAKKNNTSVAVASLAKNKKKSTEKSSVVQTTKAVVPQLFVCMSEVIGQRHAQ